MKTLAPLGIAVKQTYTDENLNADDKLPFDNCFFDVSINRHESFDLEKLLDFQRDINEKGYIKSTDHRFLIVARKINN